MPRWCIVSVVLAAFFGVFVNVSLAASTGDLYVAPDGNDAWSGRLAAANAGKTDGPLATLERARLVVRDLKAQQPQRQTPIVVLVRGGTYRMTQPVVFEPADSGSAQAPVVYQAYEGEQPVLSGGVRISGWKVGEQGRWETTLDEVAKGAWSFTQLYVNDQRRLRPTLPKQGYYQIADQLPPTEKSAKKGADQFAFSGDQIKADWANLGDVEVSVCHEWTTSRMRIASVDAAKHAVVFTGHTRGLSNWCIFRKNYRFFVENIREALSEPGQWYLDRPTGKLTYLPRPGENPEQTVVVAPRAEQLVLFRGDPKKKQWVHDLTFSGLSFAHTNWVLPPQGQSFPQAEVNLMATIAAVGARGLRFDGCAMRHLGGYAMGFGLGCRDNRVENCELVDLGGGGVKIGSAGPGSWEDSLAAPKDPDLVISHHVIRNCTIAHGGRLHPAAVGVWIGHCPHNVIEHNDIFDFYYTGVSAGWVWGYAPSLATHNDIGWNHIHTLGQRVLSDMGGVYTLGISPGTVVHDNRIHDVYSFSYGGWGLYTDEGSTDIVMENNLVYRTKSASFHQHYGKENCIRNNILVDATDAQIMRSRSEQHLSFFLEQNIICWKNSQLLGSNWKDYEHYRLDDNLYWCTTGQPIKFPGNLDFAAWQAKRHQDRHSIVADPGFIDPSKDDYRLKPDSPALKLGFKPFDYTKAGRTTPPLLTQDLPEVPRTFPDPGVTPAAK